MKTRFLNLCMLSLLIIFIIFADIIIASSKSSLSLCISSVIPSLFPFFVVSSLCISTGFYKVLCTPLAPIMHKLFGTSQASSSALILGFIGGYPIGAKTICDLLDHHVCTKKEADRLIFFANNTGPAFIIGVCGSTLLRSVRLGIILYIIHIISAIINGVIYNIIYPQRINLCLQISNSTDQPFISAFTCSIKNAIMSCINICAFIIFFSIVLNLLIHFNLSSLVSFYTKIDMLVIDSFIKGVFEIAAGLYSLSAIKDPTTIMCLSSFILAFGSISVLFQTINIINTYKISIKNCILGKITHSIIAVVLCRLVCFFLNNI